MSETFDFHNVGLGFAFQQNVPVFDTSIDPFHEAIGGEAVISNSPSWSGSSQFRPRHQRTRSAIAPSRTHFKRSQPLPGRRQIPRSANPVQGSFDQWVSAEYTHTAPGTPWAGIDREVAPEQDRFLDHGEQDMLFQKYEPRSQNQYTLEHQFMNSPLGLNGTQNVEDSPASSTSHFYMTPELQTTPFSDLGCFSVAESFENKTAFGTSLLSSPAFRDYQFRPECPQDGLYEDNDIMPEAAYVPTQITNFPPTQPSTLRNSYSYDEDLCFGQNEIGHEESMPTPPASSPPSSPSQSDRKVAYSRWTTSEDLCLRDAISKYGDGKWSLVSQMVPGRTPMQCSTRWQGALNTAIHKGRWEPEEDAILIKAVAEWQAWQTSQSHGQTGHGDGCSESSEEMSKIIPWSTIARLLPKSRTGVQALARWSEALDPRITKGKWTAAEDASLLRGINRHGKCWIKVAMEVQGRTQRQCRTRYCQISERKRRVKADSADKMAENSELQFPDL